MTDARYWAFAGNSLTNSSVVQRETAQTQTQTKTQTQIQLLLFAIPTSRARSQGRVMAVLQQVEVEA